MTQAHPPTPLAPHATAAPSPVSAPAKAGPASIVSAPVPPPTHPRLAPNWLQIVLIIGLLGAAVYVALNEHYLWGALLAVAGVAFGLAFLLRRMVGDDYGRA